MDRCPTCNARYTGKKICQRCKTDIGKLIDIQKDSMNHMNEAISFFQKKKYKDMFHHAKRSYSLYQCSENIKILANAALLNNDYKLALNMWSKVNDK